MGQIINAFSYLYWGSVIVAVLYVLLSSAPVIINLVLTSQQGCIDCRSKTPCNCLEYRVELANDIERLSREASIMLRHYKSTGLPGQFDDGIGQRLSLFIVQLDRTIELLRYGGTAVMDCFETIDNFCTFFNCLDCAPNLEEAVWRVKARRDNPPETWPPAPEVSSWEHWE